MKNPSGRRFPAALALGLCGLLAGVPTGAVAADPASSVWTLRTSAVMAGGSESSDPDGWKVYSPIALEVAVRRRLGRLWDVEFVSSLQAREVERTDGEGAATNLGSIETLPLTVLVRWRPSWGGSVHPYAGVGANLTVYWEKSGALDSDDLTPSFGPAAQLGIDFDLSPAMLLNLDLRANAASTELEEDGRTLATLNIHPATFGVGLGFRF